jgi:hypothetical protein
VSTCAIRYRLDGPGPAAFIVECDGHNYLYTRGSLGAALPDQSLTAMLAASGYRWVPATGALILEQRRAGHRSEASLPLVAVGVGATSADSIGYAEAGAAIA